MLELACILVLNIEKKHFVHLRAAVDPFVCFISYLMVSPEGFGRYCFCVIIFLLKKVNIQL